ncbi:MAG TPA: hypothetical protein VGP72_11940, partial [Planctomycetota bacterium]
MGNEGEEEKGRKGEGEKRQSDGAEIRNATVRERPDSGLTAEELKDPWKAMFSGGVMKMFNARKALAVKELGDVN